jgi:hypothetical protein
MAWMTAWSTVSIACRLCCMTRRRSASPTAWPAMVTSTATVCERGWPAVMLTQASRRVSPAISSAALTAAAIDSSAASILTTVPACTPREA